MNIPDDWLPTPDNINALPDPVRRYIAGIETLSDPAGIIADNTLIRDQSRLLEAKVIRLQEQVQQLEREKGELEKLVYVPGLWKCAKCDCVTVSTNLHVNSGTFSANKEPQRCPNDCGPMWRVTHKDNADELLEAIAVLASEREAGKTCEKG